jgi:uncharacterized peroxidase-related enzyme
MTFIEITPEPDASGAVAQMYEGDRALAGHVRNLAKAFSVAPEVYAAWQQLNGSIKTRMDLRRYELATLAAARRLRSSYCSLAHGSVLLEQFVDGETLQAIMADHRGAGLDEVDVAVMDLADNVAADATSITEADIDRLRELGLSDSEIFDVVAAAAARCFFSKTLDALGVEPDAQFSALDDGLRGALTVGREIAAAP